MSADADFAPLIPELACSDFAASIHHYRDVFSFRIRFKRRRFAMVERDGAQIMLTGTDSPRLISAPLERPFGRGMHLRIAITDVADLADDIEAAGHSLAEPLHEVWYPLGREDAGYKQILVQDLDGYLIRFAQAIGRRPRVT
ncbi:MAG: VOC family protein [Pseudomonadota bacterium]